MAQPKTGNTHLRGSQFIGSGLYVTGVARIAGAVNIGGALTVTGALTVAGAVANPGNLNIGGTLRVTGASTFVGAVSLPSGTVQNTDIATGANGFLYSQNLTFHPGHGVTYTSLALTTKLAALSGQAGPGLKFMPPGIAITVRGLAFSFQTAPSHASGARFSIRSIPSASTQVHKGYVTLASGKISAYKSGLSATIPANNAVGIAVNLAGKTVSGSNMNITVYYTRN
jgi:hypothetical protein